MFDIYFPPDYPSCPPQVLITTTGELVQERLHLLRPGQITPGSLTGVKTLMFCSGDAHS